MKRANYLIHFSAITFIPFRYIEIILHNGFNVFQINSINLSNIIKNYKKPVETSII